MKNFCTVIKISIKANIWYQSTVIVLNKYSVKPENLGGGGGPSAPKPPCVYIHFIDPNYMRISAFLPRGYWG